MYSWIVGRVFCALIGLSDREGAKQAGRCDQFRDGMVSKQLQVDFDLEEERG